jgi:hypothetical protein
MTEFSSRFHFQTPPETATVKSTWESFKKLATEIDEVNQGHHDFLQAGVIESTDWQFTSEVTAAGEIQSAANTGGKAWVPDPVLGTKVLMRTEAALGSGVVHGLKPGSLPAAGKFLTVGVELTGTTWNAAPTVSVVSGVEKTTEAEAIAAPPAVTAGKIRIKNVTLKNTSGVYSQVGEEDVRSWSSVGPWLNLALNAKIVSATGMVSEVPKACVVNAGRAILLKGAIELKEEVTREVGELWTFPATIKNLFSEVRYVGVPFLVGTGKREAFPRTVRISTEGVATLWDHNNGENLPELTRATLSGVVIPL